MLSEKQNKCEQNEHLFYMKYKIAYYRNLTNARKTGTCFAFPLRIAEKPTEENARPACKRRSLALQKTVFCNAIDGLLEGERRPFAAHGVTCWQSNSCRQPPQGGATGRRKRH